VHGKRGCKQIFTVDHSIVANPLRIQRRRENTRISQSAKAARIPAEMIIP